MWDFQLSQVSGLDCGPERSVAGVGEAGGGRGLTVDLMSTQEREDRPGPPRTERNTTFCQL